MKKIFIFVLLFVSIASAQDNIKPKFEFIIDPEWQSTESKFTIAQDDVVFTFTEIIETLELAVEMIGPINKRVSYQITVRNSVLIPNNKPSVDLRNEAQAMLEEAETLEQKEQNLIKIKALIKRLKTFF